MPFQPEDVDICVTCITGKPPKLPLREELPSLGVELVYRAGGQGFRLSRTMARKQVESFRSEQARADLTQRRFFHGKPEQAREMISERHRIERELRVPQALSYELYQSRLKPFERDSVSSQSDKDDNDGSTSSHAISLQEEGRVTKAPIEAFPMPSVSPETLSLGHNRSPSTPQAPKTPCTSDFSDKHDETKLDSINDLLLNFDQVRESHVSSTSDNAAAATQTTTRESSFDNIEYAVSRRKDDHKENQDFLLMPREETHQNRLNGGNTVQDHVFAGVNEPADTMYRQKKPVSSKADCTEDISEPQLVMFDEVKESVKPDIISSSQVAQMIQFYKSKSVSEQPPGKQHKSHLVKSKWQEQRSPVVTENSTDMYKTKDRNPSQVLAVNSSHIDRKKDVKHVVELSKTNAHAAIENKKLSAVESESAFMSESKLASMPCNVKYSKDAKTVMDLWKVEAQSNRKANKVPPKIADPNAMPTSLTEHMETTKPATKKIEETAISSRQVLKTVGQEENPNSSNGLRLSAKSAFTHKEMHSMSNRLFSNQSSIPIILKKHPRAVSSAASMASENATLVTAKTAPTNSTSLAASSAVIQKKKPGRVANLIEIFSNKSVSGEQVSVQ